MKERIHNAVFSISPAELRRAESSVFQVAIQKIKD
jgi:hypothetical protein